MQLQLMMLLPVANVSIVAALGGVVVLIVVALSVVPVVVIRPWA